MNTHPPLPAHALSRPTAWLLLAGLSLGCGTGHPPSADPQLDADWATLHPDSSGVDSVQDTGTTALPPIDALVFESPAPISDDIDYNVVFADINGDGLPDFVHAEAGPSLVWSAGDGAGGAGARASLDAALDELIALASGPDSAPDWVGLGTVEPVAQADGDALLVNLYLELRGEDPGWVSAVGLLSAEPGGRHTATLLGRSPHALTGTRAGDLDDNGLDEVLVDDSGTVHLLWNADPADLQTLGVTTAASIYPQARATDLDGDGTQELLFFANWGYGINEVWAWDDSGAFLRISERYAQQVHSTDTVAASSIDHIAVATEGPALTPIDAAVLGDPSRVVGGNLDGSGRLTLVGTRDTALRIDGITAEPLPVSLPRLDYGARVVDLDQDGLDDVLVWDGTHGWMWQENVSDHL